MNSLAADAFGTAHAFLVAGSTASFMQSMSLLSRLLYPYPVQAVTVAAGVNVSVASPGKPGLSILFRIKLYHLDRSCGDISKK